MNKEEFEGNWSIAKGKIKEKWGKFTDDDLTRINGKYDQMIGTLQKYYGYDRQKAEEEFRNWKYDKKDKAA
ncbi:MAG: CsbD family protein [Chlamydiota bacterium]